MTQPMTGLPRDGAADAMLDIVRATPGQWARALAIARGARLSRPRPRSVVVAGMGGSGIAGDVAAIIAAEQAAVPVVAVHDDVLPAFVGREDLVVLVSHSGGTAETLACARQARERGAGLVAVTAGGALAAAVAEAGGTVVRVPDGGPPRASMALLTVPVLAVLEGAGLVTGALAACSRIPDGLRVLLTAWGEEPLRLAHGIGDRSPVFLGVGPVAGVVATRARNQVAENAERPAVAASLPEAGHNQLVGWAGAGTAGACDLVVLRPADEAPATARRVEALVELAASGFAAVHEHRLPSDGTIEQVAAGFLFVDLVSVHLALSAGVDPMPIEPIEELKRRL